MRIAQLVTTLTFLPKYYASTEYIICRGLAKRGHEVTLFTTDRQPKWQTLRKGETKNRIEKYEGFTVHRNNSGPEIGIIPLIPSLFPKLFHMDYDIIHAHDYCSMSSFYGAVVSKIKRCPFLLTQHNYQLPSKLANELLYLFGTFTMGKFIFANSRSLIALNSDISNHLVEMGADEKKIEIIPNAVDTKLFSPEKINFLEEKWKISHPVILFVGRLVEDKGVKYLLKAFSDVVRDIPDAKLVIIGEGSEEKKLKILKSKLGLDNVFFLGAIEHRFLPNIYAGCDVFVLPSIKEPFGIVAIEAMAAGKVVIGSYVGGIKDTIVHGVTGYHVQPTNTQQISSYLIRLLTDDHLRKTLGYNARIRAAKKYDQENIIDKVELIYQKLLNHSESL